MCREWYGVCALGTEAIVIASSPHLGFHAGLRLPDGRELSKDLNLATLRTFFGFWHQIPFKHIGPAKITYHLPNTTSFFFYYTTTPPAAAAATSTTTMTTALTTAPATRTTAAATARD